MTVTEQCILVELKRDEMLRGRGAAMYPRDIAVRIDRTYETTRKALNRLQRAGAVRGFRPDMREPVLWRLADPDA